MHQVRRTGTIYCGSERNNVESLQDGISATARVEACVRAIKKYDDRLGATITVMADEARTAAAHCDEAAAEGRWLGILHGMPIALKDNVSTEGVRTTSGSTFFADHVPTADAFVVRRLKEAGAIPISKTNLAEFAFGATTQNAHYGSCRNPWDVDRIPGGSSGGSGAAVASGMAVGALGTDTGGSVRIPASVNGIVGLRPTLGRVSNGGVTPVSEAFDTVGPLAHRVVDVARILAAIEGYDENDVTSVDGPKDEVLRTLGRGIEGLRVGIPIAYIDQVDPEIDATVRKAIEELERLGAHVQEIEVRGAKEAQQYMMQMLYPDAAAFHQDRVAEAPEAFGSEVLDRLKIGLQTSSLEYSNAVSWARSWRRELRRCFTDVDLIATPTAPVAPPLIDGAGMIATTHAITTLTYGWALGGLPAVSVPCGFVDGLPVGLQLAGRPWEDGLVLRAAAAYQDVTEWHLRRPSLEV